MTSKKSTPAKEEKPQLGILARDPWLDPYKEAIEGRHQHVLDRMAEITNGGKQSLVDFAAGHLYYGLHRTQKGWTIREWAPNATRIYLVGTFNNWEEDDKWSLRRSANGDWKLSVPASRIHHEDLYKLIIYWEGGRGERIPAWATRVVQDPTTHIFSAQVWAPESPYCFKVKKFRPATHPLLIYECHVGMSQEEPKVGSYEEFRKNVLPRVAKAGYNAIQVMAIQEHPYYGSFGYHVSSFFAASSRFGTPDELKALIDEAHSMGIAVILDLVHSHAVKNEAEGLGNYAGDPCQFFNQGARREHPAWDSLCFDYGRNEVIHFLLSNCRYWLEEYRFDGFRFDGVTSMLYYSHGLGEDFMGYENYFNGMEDDEAICYLTLANLLIHQVNPRAITIAEEVSGMPGLAARFEDGGYGFDYRLAMNIPDFWIKTIKEQKDEDWKPSTLFYELTNRREDEKTISYVESHDQALVGGKTVIFRLIDADMYYHMMTSDDNFMVSRGMALSKMIRLLTASTINGGYLNFMGNEFGHPEWIDFPRQGNGWSHHYARRQWSLADDENLKYHFLGRFDERMTALIKGEKSFEKSRIQEIWHNDGDQILAYKRNNLIFVFNFNPNCSFTDYGLLVPRGSYQVILNTDDKQLGGNGLNDDSVRHYTNFDPLYKRNRKEWLKLYLPSRSAMVLRKID